MVKSLNEVEAESRSELICPHCFTEGLEQVDKIAKRYSSKDKRILHATACPNESCPHHASNGDSAIIPASDIEQQYKNSSSNRSSLSNINLNRKAIVSVTFVIAVVMLLGLPSFGGGSGTGTAAAAPSEVSESSASFSPNETTGNWTVYETDGGYIVGGEIDGEVIYLTPSGEVSSTPHIFETKGGALDAIALWRETSGTLGGDGSNGTEPDPLGPTNQSGIVTTDGEVYNGTELDPNPYNQTAISFYEYNNSYVLASVQNGSVVYLGPNSEFSTTPYFYDNRTAATNYFIEYVSENGLDQTADGEPLTAPKLEQIQTDLDGLISSDPPSHLIGYLTPDGESPSDGTRTDSETITGGTLNGSETTTSDGTGSDGELTGPTDGEDFSGDEETDLNAPNYISDSNHTISGTIEGSDSEVTEGTVQLRSVSRSTQITSDGTFSFANVPAGDHKIWVEPAKNGLPATPPVNITVAENGSVYIRDDTNSALYLENEDGSVSSGSLTLLTQPARSISLSGEGNDLSASIEFENDANAKSINLTIRPVVRANPDTTALGPANDTTSQFTVGGTSTPQDATLALAGVPASKTVFKTGNLSEPTTLETEGNLPPRQATLDIKGTSEESALSTSGTTTDTTVELAVDGNRLSELKVQLEGTTESSGWTTSITPSESELVVPGNIDPVDTTLTFTGQEVVTPRSQSGTTDNVDLSLSNPGNKLEDLDVTISGKTIQNQWSSQTFRDTFPTVSVPGNLNPTDTEITFTGQGGTTNRQDSGTAANGDTQISVDSPWNRLTNLDVTVSGNTETEDWTTGQQTGSKSVTVPGNIPPTQSEMVLTGAVNIGATQTPAFELDEQTVDTGLNVIDKKESGNLRQGGADTFEIDSTANIVGYNGDSTPEVVLTANQPKDVTNIDFHATDGWSSHTKLADVYPSDEYYIKYSYVLQGEDHFCSSPNEVSVALRDGSGGDYIKQHHLTVPRDGAYRSGSNTVKTTLSSSDELHAQRDRFQPCTLEEQRVSSELHVDKMWREPGPDPATITVNGNSYDIGTLAPGETKTIKLSELTDGQNTISLDSSGWADLDYEVRWGKQTGFARETTVNNPGNVGAELNVTMSGREGSNSRYNSESLRAGDSFTSTIKGNTDPTGPGTGNNPRLRLSGGTPTTRVHDGETYNWPREQGFGGSTTVFTASKTGTYKLAVRTSWKFAGDTCLFGSKNNAFGSVTVGGDRVYREGESHDGYGYATGSDWGYITTTIEKGQEVGIGIGGMMCEHSHVKNDQTYIKLRYATYEQEVGDTTVTVNGDSTYETYDVGKLGSGDTTSISLSSLSPGEDVTVSTSTSGGHSDIYAALDWNDITKTKDASLTLDGSDVCSSSGLMSGTQTCSVPAGTFSAGDHDLVASSKDMGFDYSLSYTPKTVTKDVSVSIDGGDGGTIEQNGRFGPDDSISRGLPDLESGSQTVSVSRGEGPAPTWELSATGRTAVEKPGLYLDGDRSNTQIGSQYLREGQTVTRSLSDMTGSGMIASSDSAHTLAISSANNVPIEYSFQSTSKQRTVNPSVDVGNDGTVNADPSANLWPGEQVTVGLNGLKHGSQSLDIRHQSNGPVPLVDISGTTRTAAKDPSVTLDGATAATPALLRDGETTTVTLEDLYGTQAINSPSSSHALSISTENGLTVPYSVNWNSVQETRNPGVDIGDDGSVDAEVNRYLDSGEQATVSLSDLQHGAQPISLNYGGPAPIVELSTTTREAAESPAVILNKRGSSKDEAPALLREGDTTTVTLESLTSQSWINSTTDSHTLLIKTQNSVPVKYNVNWNDVAITDQPSVSSDGRVYCHSNTTLTGTLSCDIPREEFSDGSGITISSDAGPMEYNFSYQKRVAPADATITINGNEYSYPEDFLGSSSEIRSKTSPLAVNGLSLGENAVSVQTDTVSGLQPDVEPILSYDEMVTTSSVPTITVSSTEGTHSASLNELTSVSGSLSNTRTVTLPKAWFSTGKNTIRLNTPDGTPISVEVNGTALNKQTGSLD